MATHTTRGRRFLLTSESRRPSRRTLVEETMLHEAQTVFETNFFGIVRMTQATMLVLLRRLLPQGGFELLVRRMFGMEGRSLSHRSESVSRGRR